MTLDEVNKEIVLCKEQLAKVPAIEKRMYHLLGMREVLEVNQEESEDTNNSEE